MEPNGINDIHPVKPSRPIVLGINGFKKSGKTTLIERLVAALAPAGLRLAAIKTHSEPVATDAAGTDTYRLYQAGADVLGCDRQSVYLKRRQNQSFSLEAALALLGNQYDLVLVEGFKQSGIEKLWLLRAGDAAPPDNIDNIIAVLDWADDPRQRLKRALALLQSHLAKPDGD